MKFTTTQKGILAFSALIASSFFTTSIVAKMAEEKCYGPAFPEIPMCSMVQDLK